MISPTLLQATRCGACRCPQALVQGKEGWRRGARDPRLPLEQPVEALG